MIFTSTCTLDTVAMHSGAYEYSPYGWQVGFLQVSFDEPLFVIAYRTRHRKPAGSSEPFPETSTWRIRSPSLWLPASDFHPVRIVRCIGKTAN
jgi:hypothetical protein